jgi:hypothetical protein
VDAGLPAASAHALAADGGTLYATVPGAEGAALAYRLAPGATAWSPVAGAAGAADAIVAGGGAVVATSGGAYRLEAGAWSPVGAIGPSGEVGAIARAADGTTYASVMDRVYARRTGGWDAVGGALAGGLGYVTALRVAPDGTVLASSVGETGAVHRLVNGAWRPAGSGLGGGAVLDLAVGASGVVYAATAEDGVYRLSNGAWSRLGGANAPVAVRTLALDGAGALYAAVMTGGASSAAPEPARGTAASLRAALHASKTAPSLVFRWDGRAWSATGKGLGDGPVSALAADASGRMHAGSRGAVYRLDGAHWKAVGMGLPQDANAFVTSLAFDAGGVAVAGVSLHGVYRLDGNRWRDLGLGLFDSPGFVVLPGDGGVLVGTVRGLYLGAY